jgi:capsular exopolysaccharide synthesis family protein
MEFDLLRYIRLLLKRKWYFLLGLVLCIGAGMLITAATTPVYQATAKLFVGQRQVTVEQLGKGLAVTNLSDKLVRSYSQIIASRSIAQRAISDGGLSQTPGEIVAGLIAQPVVDTQVITVTYHSSDPVVAQRVVNAVTRAFVAEIDQSGAQEPGTPALEVSIIDPAVAPATPIEPQPLRNMALAIVIGLVVGGALALLADYLDQSVKSREELEQMGIQVLGSIPTMETGGAEVHLERDSQGFGGESFRKLRTSIGFLGVESPLRVILVTSSLPQEGKTTLSLNLASAYALGGFRTLLVEADLRRPSLHRVFGMYGTRGLTTVIVGGVSLEEAILNTETRNLSVLLAGAIPPNPVELLGSEQMIDVVNRLRMMFDVVIVDSPPVVPVADPATLANLSDGVVVVARAGKTDRRRIAETVEILRRAGGRFLGVALNFLLPGETTYDYQYYYYGQRSAKKRDAGRTLERHG